MTRYRKVELAMWRDERFVALSAAPPNGQTLWMYLLTGPRTTTFPGLVIGREAVMADDLGWTVEAFREAFAEALREGLVEACWKVGLVVLRKALFDSAGDPRDTARPASPNVIRSWARTWDEVPDCALKRKYLDRLGSFAAALGEAFLEAFREAFRKALAKPSPNQDQDQDQDQEQEIEDSDTTLSVGSRVPNSTPNGTKSRRVKPSTPTESERASALVVLERLGSRNGVRYTGSAEHVRLITNQLRNGVSEADLRKVVKYCAEKLKWQGDEDMEQWLRPETLFGPKTIAKYLDAARTWFDSLPPHEREFENVELPPALELVP